MIRHRASTLPAGPIALAAAAALAVLAPLAAAPAARAADYCVNDPACVTAGGSARPSLQNALSTAAATTAADRVFVGAGVYDVSATGGASYAGGSALELIGRGAATTVLTQSVFGAPSYPSVLTLDQQASAVVVRDLGIRLGDGSGGRGLELRDGAQGLRVRIEDPAGASNGNGVHLFGGTLTDADIDLDGTGASGLSIVSAAAGTQVEGGTVRAAGTAVSVDVGPGQVTYLHGFTAVGGSALSVTRGRAVVDSAVLRGSGLNAVAVVQNSNVYTGELRAILRHVTIAGGGNAQQIGLRVRGAMGGQHATAKLLDSIVTAVGRPLARSVQNGGSASIVTERVNHGPIQADDDPTDPGDGTLSETLVTNVDPRFADAAAGDLRLAQGSPLIDAGRTAGLDFDEPGAALLGAGRILDGDGDGVARRDLGAYEYVRPAVEQPGGGTGTEGGGGAPLGGDGAGGAGGAGGGAGAGDGAGAGSGGTAAADRRAPRLTRLRVGGSARRPLLTGRIDEAARVTVAIRRAGGRRPLRTLRVRIGRAGALRIALPAGLKPGRYALAVQAADAAGNRGGAVRVRFARRRG